MESDMYEISLIANQFLDEQKSGFLKKKIEQETREKRKKFRSFLAKHENKVDDDDHIKEKNKLESSLIEAEKKAMDKFINEANTKYEINDWFKKAYSKAKPYVTTHPAKFTNPKISKASNLLFYGNPKIDGYVKTGNVKLSAKVDVSGDAATNTIIFELYTFLGKQVENGNRFIDLFERDDPSIIEFIQSLGLNYYSVKDTSIDVFYGNESEQCTHELVRQIYFPIKSDSTEYHLLSIVTPSIIMYEAKNRIEAFDRWIDGHNVRSLKAKNKYDSIGFDEIYNITEIGFSHTEFTKMGNVSYLNVRNKGIAFLLPCSPPSLKRRNIRLPSHDFFKNSLYFRDFEENFKKLDELMGLEINTINIRNGINNTLKFIIDSVLQQVFKIRTSGIGWSDKEHYQVLPLAQRIWLDDKFIEQREQDEAWVEEIAGDFARWIINAYEYLCKDSRTRLSDDEWRELASLAEEAVAADKGFFK